MGTMCVHTGKEEKRPRQGATEMVVLEEIGMGRTRDQRRFNSDRALEREIPLKIMSTSLDTDTAWSGST